MSNIQLFSKKRILVVGLAKTGLAATQVLLKLGADVIVADINIEKPDVQKNANKLHQLGAKIELGPHKIQSFIESDMIVISPGVPHTISPIKEARKKNIPVIGETELAFRLIDIPIIGITGTNGKTTTTELTGDMLKKSGKKVFVGGNIGTPFSEIYLSNQIFDIAVLELSSFQLDTIEHFCPDVAILLNISEDHLNRYKNMSQYVKSKFNIFMNQQENHKAILNGLDHYCTNNYSRIKSSVYWLDSNKPQWKNRTINCQQEEIKTPFQTYFDVSKSSLLGHHNRQNLAAAILASQLMGASVDGIQRSINSFKTLPHRIEYIDTIKGVQFYNDSKATNVDATVKALQHYRTPVHIILGGLDKGGDYSRLVPMIKKCVCECILIGQASPIIEKTLSLSKDISHIPIHHSKTLEDATKHAFDQAHAGETILLSPACASFDMFDSYIQRGDLFKQAVNSLRKRHDK